MSAFGGKVNTSVRKSAAAKLIDRKKFCELMPPTTLATGDSRASSSQGSPTSPRGVNQPAFTSCVCEGADKLAALQPNFKGFLLNPRICPWRAGIHSGGRQHLQHP